MSETHRMTVIVPVAEGDEEGTIRRVREAVERACAGAGVAPPVVSLRERLDVPLTAAQAEQIERRGFAMA